MLQEILYITQIAYNVLTPIFLLGILLKKSSGKKTEPKPPEMPKPPKEKVIEKIEEVKPEIKEEAVLDEIKPIPHPETKEESFKFEELMN